jgi:hypothetical protein
MLIRGDLLARDFVMTVLLAINAQFSVVLEVIIKMVLQSKRSKS